LERLHGWNRRGNGQWGYNWSLQELMQG
jgi:hypothetical protein